MRTKTYHFFCRFLGVGSDRPYCEDVAIQATSKAVAEKELTRIYGEELQCYMFDYVEE